MTPKLSFVTAVVGAALVLAVPAYGDPWGADRSAAMVHVSPDLVDRVAAARQQELSSMLDARERSFAARSDAGIVSPDPVRDDRFQLGAASTAAPAGTIGSADEIEWLQIGIGFGGGVLLAISLLLATRLARPRLPAH